MFFLGPRTYRKKCMHTKFLATCRYTRGRDPPPPAQCGCYKTLGGDIEQCSEPHKVPTTSQFGTLTVMACSIGSTFPQRLLCTHIVQGEEGPSWPPAYYRTVDRSHLCFFGVPYGALIAPCADAPSRLPGVEQGGVIAPRIPFTDTDRSICLSAPARRNTKKF